MSNDGRDENTEPLSPSELGECPEALAYDLWEQAGRPEGQAAYFWKQAETQIGQLRPLPAPSHRQRLRLPFQYPVA